MAKFNREFLVPYLEDVCALYMADLEVCAKMFGVQKEILVLQHGEEIEPPVEPEHEEYLGAIGSFLGGVGIVLMCAIFIPLMDLFIPENERGSAPFAFYIIFGAVSFLLGLFLWKSFGEPEREVRKNNEELDRQYEEAVRQYRVEKRKISERNEEARKKIPDLEKQMGNLSNERKKIAKTLDAVYAANIIPSHYRDMYAAVYLYDFFSTSRSNDLDMALNTYVLEQIKDKLDVIIEKQHESILNQRLILANQQKSLEEQRAHNAYMRQKVYQIASSLEEQNQYLAMVESNSAATAYFAAANCLR